MKYPELFEFGKSTFSPNKNVYDTNPYRQIILPPEAVPFFNGWEWARKEHDKSSTYSIFLDDFRFPNWVNWIELPNTYWQVARHYYSFISLIEKHGLPDFISWDYDLDQHGFPEITNLNYKNGLDCAKWTIDYCEKNKLSFPKSIVHSQNPEGRIYIYDTIKSYLESKGIPA
jgi:hypothetical protein